MSLLRSTVQRPKARVAKPGEAPADALYKAERAKMLLDDDILAGAFDTIEGEAIEAALRATATDDERRRAADRANAIREVRIMLDGLVNKAEQAAKERLVLP
jgi:hypothetical protein